MTPESNYRPTNSDRGYPCPRCGQRTFEFFGLGDDALCRACRKEIDDLDWLLGDK